MHKKEYIKFEEVYQHGLIYALDSNGNYIAAKDAEKGKIYYCPICGIPMFKTRTKKGRAVFKRKAHVHHKSSICEKIERTGKCHTLDKIPPEKLIAKLCHVPDKRQGGSRNKHGGKKKGGTEGDDETVEIAFTSLKSIHDSGIDNFLEDEQTLKNGYKLQDYIIFYDNVELLFKNLNYNIGCRIVEAKYDHYIIDHQTDTMALIFRMFIKDANGKYQNIRFVARFLKEDVFLKILRRIVSFEKNIKDDGTLKTDSIVKNDTSLIAAIDWEPLSEEICKNSYCKGKHCTTCAKCYMGTIVREEQIYTYSFKK